MGAADDRILTRNEAAGDVQRLRGSRGALQWEIRFGEGRAINSASQAVVEAPSGVKDRIKAPGRPEDRRLRLTPQRAISALKVVVFLLCLLPLALLVLHGFENNLGPDPIATITHGTGFATLRLLVITLAITPVRHLWVRLGWLIRFRRMLGLFAFFYGCLHLTTYVWLFSNFKLGSMLQDIGHRRFIMVGFAAWVLMVPLAVTSTQRAIRKLGGKRWRALHRLIYVSAVCGVIHYWWIVKPGVRTPMKITLILAALLAVRFLWPLVESRRRGAGAAIR